MGLKKNITTTSGIDVSNAYHRIGDFYGNDKLLEFRLDSYVSRESCLEGLSIISSQAYSFELDISDDAPNFIRQAYGYLKSTDDYLEANDVLEKGQTPL